MAVGSGVVAWSDTDASGRFHWTSAFRWVENVEHSLYAEVLGPDSIGRFPRRTVSATYHRGLHAGDGYRVELLTERVGTTSIAYRWQILRAETLCVDGTHVVVYVDSDGVPAPVPDELRSAAAAQADADPL